MISAWFLIFGLCLQICPWVVQAQEGSLSASAEGPQPSPQTEKAPPHVVDVPVIDVVLPTMTQGPAMTLSRAIELADKRAVALRIARLEIAKTEAVLKQAWALVLPGVQGKIEYTRMDHEDTANFTDSLSALSSILPTGTQLPRLEDLLINPRDKLLGIIQVGMPLINAQNWFTVSSASKAIEVANWSVEDGRQQLLLMVAKTYLMALEVRSLIDMRREQLVATRKHLGVATARFESGSGLRIDVVRAEGEFERARQDLVAAHLLFDNARDGIRVLTDSDELPMPVSDHTAISAPDGDEDDLVEASVESRSAIKAKRAMVDVRKAQRDAAWMQFVPTLDVGWQFQYQFTEMADLGSKDRSRWALVLTATVPLYNQFRYGDLDYKRAALRQAILDEEDTTNNIAMNVRVARRDYLAALAEVEIARRLQNLASEGLALMEAAYESGAGSSLEVSTSRRQMSEAQTNLVVKELDAQISLLELLRSAGQDMQAIGR